MKNAPELSSSIKNSLKVGYARAIELNGITVLFRMAVTLSCWVCADCTGISESPDCVLTGVVVPIAMGLA